MFTIDSRGNTSSRRGLNIAWNGLNIAYDHSDCKWGTKGFWNVLTTDCNSNNTKFESLWLTEEGGFELEVKRGDVDEHAAHYKQHGVQSFNPGILHDGGHDQEHAD